MCFLNSRGLFYSDSRMLKNIDEKLCGMLVLKNNDYECEFLWAHTTPSLCIGYMDTASNKAKVQDTDIVDKYRM